MISEGSCETEVMMLKIQLCITEINVPGYVCNPSSPKGRTLRVIAVGTPPSVARLNI